MIITISGLIGCGKSTLTKKLSEKMGYKPVYEPVKSNPYLDDFYEFPEKYGTIMQFFLLTKRFKQQQEMIWNINSEEIQGFISDRSIQEDTLFANLLFKSGTMSKRDYDTYIEHFNVMKRFLVYPDIFLFLDVKPEVAYERLKKRNRKCESEVPLEYLQALDAEYRDFVEEMSQYTTVVRIDYNEFKTVDYIIDEIEKVKPLNKKFHKSLLEL